MGEQTDDKGTGGGITVADIRKLVTDTVGEAVKGLNLGGSVKTEDTPKGDTGTGKSVAQQVQEALAGIKEKTAREERDKSIDQALAELKEKTAEKPPVERRRVHKIMGWGD